MQMASNSNMFIAKITTFYSVGGVDLVTSITTALLYFPGTYQVISFTIYVHFSSINVCFLNRDHVIYCFNLVTIENFGEFRMVSWISQINQEKKIISAYVTIKTWKVFNLI
jgi:hypothetical protein